MKDIIKAALLLQRVVKKSDDHWLPAMQALRSLQENKGIAREIRRATGWVTRTEMRKGWLIPTEEAKKPHVLGIEQTTYSYTNKRTTYLFKISDLDSYYHRIEDLTKKYGDLNWRVICDELRWRVDGKESALEFLDYCASLGGKIQGTWDAFDELENAGVSVYGPFVFPDPIRDLSQSLLDAVNLNFFPDPLSIREVLPFLVTIAGNAGWREYAADETDELQDLSYLGVVMSSEYQTSLTGEELKTWVFERFEESKDGVFRVKSIPNFLRWVYSDRRRWGVKTTVLTI